MPEKILMELPLSKIRSDGGTQARARVDQETVLDYADNVRLSIRCRCGHEWRPFESICPKCGARRPLMPPIIVFHDGKIFWLGDGFHRVLAHLEAKCKTITADVRKGTLRDAILFAVGANVDHGLRRTNEDKRHAVGLLLLDNEWQGWSNHEISRRCGVSEHLVRLVRLDLAGASAPKTQMRLARRGAQIYPIRPALRDMETEESCAIASQRHTEARQAALEHLRPARRHLERAGTEARPAAAYVDAALESLAGIAGRKAAAAA